MLSSSASCSPERGLDASRAAIFNRVSSARALKKRSRSTLVLFAERLDICLIFSQPMSNDKLDNCRRGIYLAARGLNCTAEKDVICMKKIGFLSFGHWAPSPHSQTQSAADVLLQSIDLAIEAERLGRDGGI